MIRSMRLKFTAVALISTVLVLFLLIGGINFSNYKGTVKDVDMRLTMIADNGGSFPGGLEGRKPEPRSELQPDQQLDPQTSKQPGQQPGQQNNFIISGLLGRKENMPLEAAFATRYFSVTLSAEGEIVSTDVDNIYAIDETTAGEMAKDLLESGKTKGFYGNYRFLRLGSDDIVFTFLDCERELNSFYAFLKYSVLISILGTVLIAVLIWFLSVFVVRPMAESYEKQKRFITDAGHELKTPLTIIDANTEVIETENGENEWTKSIHNQIGRLSDLVNKLILLSRMDEEATKLEMTEFNVSEAVNELVDDFSVVAAAKEKSIDAKIEDDLRYCGDIDKIKQVVSLLLDNAVKYASDKSEISVKLSKSGKNIRFSVLNEVDSISKGPHEEFFERFYRGDESHNQKTGGHGIGLSVAKAIVLKHKGRIKAVSEDGKSIEFSVVL